MNRDEQVKTLLTKYGAIEVSRVYIRGIRAALSNIRNGIETNNFALASKDVGLLAEHLACLETVYGMEDGRKQIQHLDKEAK